ncbi:MAG: SRPBCC family protein [Acidimicrobiia bacterium]|nr:SRPBCC family protein [Acidimicrobiia bacterium]
MATVQFEVRQPFDAPARAVWDALVDWSGHAEWIPMTRVSVEPGDSTEPGARFTAWTGPGPLALEDRMEVESCDWDDELGGGRCVVRKLGPVLRGRAGFTVLPTDHGSELRWFEDVTVPLVPQLLSPVVTKLSAAGFRHGMRNLARQLTTTRTRSTR